MIPLGRPRQTKRLLHKGGSELSCGAGTTGRVIISGSGYGYSIQPVCESMNSHTVTGREGIRWWPSRKQLVISLRIGFIVILTNAQREHMMFVFDSEKFSASNFDGGTKMYFKKWMFSVEHIFYPAKYQRDRPRLTPIRNRFPGAGSLSRFLVGGSRFPAGGSRFPPEMSING